MAFFREELKESPEDVPQAQGRRSIPESKRDQVDRWRGVGRQLYLLRSRGRIAREPWRHVVPQSNRLRKVRRARRKRVCGKRIARRLDVGLRGVIGVTRRLRVVGTARHRRGRGVCADAGRDGPGVENTQRRYDKDGLFESP